MSKQDTVNLLLESIDVLTERIGRFGHFENTDANREINNRVMQSEIKKDPNSKNLTTKQASSSSTSENRPITDDNGNIISLSNGKLKPNLKFKMFGVEYETDSNGRTCRVDNNRLGDDGEWHPIRESACIRMAEILQEAAAILEDAELD